MSMIQQEANEPEMNAYKREYCVNDLQLRDICQQYNKLLAFIRVHFRLINTDRYLS